ncbi:tripartite tricarboxylate transporter substrate-binding protein [Cupriavidus basilensis]
MPSWPVRNWPWPPIPTAPIKLVVPYTPGGSTDQFGARGWLMARSRELKQTVVVENRPGAATMIGTQSVARAPADGYTMVLATNGSTWCSTRCSTRRSPTIRRATSKIFTIGAEAPLVVVTNNQVPATNIREFAAYAKASGGKLNYASVGPRQRAAAGHRNAKDRTRHLGHSTFHTTAARRRCRRCSPTTCS